jgi:hypothetical protein
MRWRGAILTTFVPMPETAVNEDGGFVFGQNDVGTNKEGFGFWGWGFGNSTPHLYPLPVRGGEEIGRNWDSDVQTESKSHFVQVLAHGHFRFRILAANPRHVPRTLFFGEPILVHG